MDPNNSFDWIEGLRVRDCPVEGEMNLRVGYLARLLKEMEKRISGWKHPDILSL